MSKLDVIIGSTAFSVVQDGTEHLIIGVDDEQRLVVYLRDISELELIENIEELPDEELQVKVRSLALDQLQDLPTKTPERGRRRRPEVRAVDTTALRAEREEETPRKRRVRKAHPGTYESPLEEWERHQILEMVTDSFMRFPNQSKEFTAEESHRIAKEVFGEDDHHHVMRVAGVRSALAKGMYDVTLEDILEKAHDVRGDAR